MSAALELTCKKMQVMLLKFFFVFDICQMGQIKLMGHYIGPIIGGPIEYTNYNLGSS